MPGTLPGGGDFRDIAEGAMHCVDNPEVPPEVREALGRVALSHQADLNQFDSAFQQRLAEADGPAFAPLLEQYCLERFDLCAGWFAPFAFSQDPTAINQEYERCLCITEEKSLKFLTEVLEGIRSDIREDIQTRMALKLSARILGLLAVAKAKHCERHPLPNVETLRLRVAGNSAATEPRLDEEEKTAASVDGAQTHEAEAHIVAPIKGLQPPSEFTIDKQGDPAAALTSSGVRLPETFALAGDPVDGNPFPVEDARHKVWAEATLTAEEEVCRISAESMSSLTPSNAQDWLPTLAVRKFNAWAKRGVHVVWSEGEVERYDRWLLSYANSWIDAVLQHHDGSDLPPSLVNSVLIDLRNRLGGQVQYWKAEARRYRVEQELKSAALPPVEAQSRGNKVGGPRLAVWLKAEMEKRAHLSLNRLHDLSGLDRKTIKAILNGKRVRHEIFAKLAEGLSVPVSDIPTD